tara:strand:- start:408 stop:686 length:279 start_codon:yes stop_codon:yes gene_type:complete
LNVINLQKKGEKLMIAPVTEKESIIWASGHYLTEQLPEDYDEWTDKYYCKYILDHAWEPFEHAEAYFIIEYIDVLAADFRKTVNNRQENKCQ